MPRFLFVDKRELFAMKLCFEGFNLVFFSADQSAWLVLNQPTLVGFQPALSPDKDLFSRQF